MMGKESRKNRDILIALVLAGIVTAAAGGFFLYRQHFEEYLTWEDPMYGIRIQHPASWSTAFEHKILKPNETINLIAFRTPEARAGDIDNFVNITAYRVAQGFSFPDRMELELAELKRSHPHFRLLESAETVLGGLPARRFVFSFSRNGTEYKKLLVYTQKGLQGYVLSYLQNAKNFGWHTKQVDKMIRSFEFIGS